MEKKVVLCVILFALTHNVFSKSFTVVIDTTLSMREELYTIKRNMVAVFNHENNWVGIEDFVLVPFSDPDVGTPTITSTSRTFLDALFSLRAEGGHSCPENSTAGIEKALEISKPESFVFVFTDAYEKDNSKLNSITNLCRTKNSQVIIFLSGNCVHEGVIDVYYDIARECSGNVFRFDSSDFRQAFAYMTDMADSNWNYHGTSKSFSTKQDLNITVDPFTTAVSITVFGDDLEVEVSDSEGRPVHVEQIVNTNHITVIRLKPTKKLYKISINCQGNGYLSYSFNKDFPFQYGFSTKLSSNLEETSLQPLPGKLSYILLKTLDTFENANIDTVELIVYDNNDKQILETHRIKEDSNYFSTKAFFEENKPFKLLIKGHQGIENEEYSVTSNMLKSQTVVKDPQRTEPKLQIIAPETSVFDYGANTSISCKVFGYPKPNVWWEDDTGNNYFSEDILVEIPNKYVSYVYLQNIIANTTVFCKGNNSEGESFGSTEIFVKMPIVFNILHEPADETIAYGTEGKIFCEVQAYPDAVIKWYHNNTDLDIFQDFEIVSDGLVIKNMTLDKTGIYMCHIKNDFNNKSLIASISISGLVTPTVSVVHSEVIARVNDSVEIQCRIVSGIPAPTVYWTYKTSKETNFGNLPSGTMMNGTNLIIAKINNAHVGLFKCEAVNEVGSSSREVVIKVYQPPVIKNKVTQHFMVKEGDLIELPCEVIAEPKAQVHWVLSQNNVIVPFNESAHSTDSRNTLRFIAMWHDSGDYRCIADNGVGKAEIKITLNVLVPPYIQTPSQKAVVARAGDTVDMRCDVLYGNPIPTVNWAFVAAIDSSIKTIPRTSTTTLLQLRSVTSANEGQYICVADNSIGSDTIKINLKVI